MANFTTTSDEVKTHVEKCTIQSRSNQDYSWYHIENNKTWIVVLDGHGRHKNPQPIVDLVKMLKEYNWKQLMKTRQDRNPILVLEEKIKLIYQSTSGIGASISIIEIVDNKNITIWWKGDAAVKIFEKNGEDINIVATTKIPSMEEEKRRLATQNISAKTLDGWQVCGLNETELTMRKNPIYVFENSENINMSQSIGHNGLTGLVDQKLEFTVKNNHEYRVWAGSDGVWDIAGIKDKDVINKFWTYSAEEMAAWAVNQWKREWVYVWYNTKTPGQKIGDCDDVTCVVWSKYS